MPPQVQELLASPVQLPSPYLESVIQGFQQTLETYRSVRPSMSQSGWQALTVSASNYRPRHATNLRCLLRSQAGTSAVKAVASC